MEFVKEYEFMILSRCCLISRLMTKERVITMEIDIYVKVFLFLFRSFEEKVFHDTDGNFMWYNRPNFVSLLNLPNQIEQFGDLRLYWEGSNERLIQLIKPFMKNIRKTSSFLSLQLNKLNSTTLLRNLIESENK